MISVFWQSLSQPGCERATVRETATGLRLAGTVLVAQPSPLEIRYELLCDEQWTTRGVAIEVMGSDAVRTLTLTADGLGRWWQGGEELAALTGCIDVDLGCSPLTNTLPLRRLGLAVGQTVELKAAWIRFPELSLVVAPQRYQRLDAHRYRFDSEGFGADLVVDDLGVVVSYPGGWERIAASRP